MRGTEWRDDVLRFWFDELTPEDRFSGKPEVDARIAERFGRLYAELKADLPEEAGSDPLTALAAIIVLDQFSRNLFRRRPEAFATDAQARAIALQALDRGLDARLDEAQRQFLYMPLMHSEDLADQERCVELFSGTANGTALQYAIEHRDIIARFGRFPHRNRVLGRETTPEEAAFLESHSGYGQ